MKIARNEIDTKNRSWIRRCYKGLNQLMGIFFQLNLITQKSWPKNEHNFVSHHQWILPCPRCIEKEALKCMNLPCSKAACVDYFIIIKKQYVFFSPHVFQRFKIIIIFILHTFLPLFLIPRHLWKISIQWPIASQRFWKQNWGWPCFVSDIILLKTRINLWVKHKGNDNKEEIWLDPANLLWEIGI